MAPCIPRALVITTFQVRFSEALRLVQDLRNRQVKDPIFVAINGDFPSGGHKEGARSRFLRDLTKFEGINPICLGSGRGLSYVLNASLRLSHAEKVVVLADDCVFTSGSAGRVVKRMFDDLEDSDCVILNNDMGHFAVRREALHRVGWFNEALPGIGWEDTDFIFRIILDGGLSLRFRRDEEVWNSGSLSGFDDIVPEKEGSKYSLINKTIMRSILWNFNRKVGARGMAKVSNVGGVVLNNLPPARPTRSMKSHAAPFEKLHEELWDLHKASDSKEIQEHLGIVMPRYLRRKKLNQW